MLISTSSSSACRKAVVGLTIGLAVGEGVKPRANCSESFLIRSGRSPTAVLVGRNDRREKAESTETLLLCVTTISASSSRPSADTLCTRASDRLAVDAARMRDGRAQADTAGRKCCMLDAPAPSVARVANCPDAAGSDICIAGSLAGVLTS